MNQPEPSPIHSRSCFSIGVKPPSEHILHRPPLARLNACCLSPAEKNGEEKSKGSDGKIGEMSGKLWEVHGSYMLGFHTAAKVTVDESKCGQVLKCSSSLNQDLATGSTGKASYPAKYVYQ